MGVGVLPQVDTTLDYAGKPRHREEEYHQSGTSDEETSSYSQNDLAA